MKEGGKGRLSAPWQNRALAKPNPGQVSMTFGDEANKTVDESLVSIIEESDEVSIIEEESDEEVRFFFS